MQGRLTEFCILFLCPLDGEQFKVSRSCGYTPGKVTGQRVTVKAEMNGFTPGLDRRPPSH